MGGVTEGLIDTAGRRLSRMVPSRCTVAAVLLQLASFTLAHGDDGDHDMDMGDVKTPESHGYVSAADPEWYTMASYAGLAMHGKMIFAHIVLMVLAWFFVLPIGMSANGSMKQGIDKSRRHV